MKLIYTGPHDAVEVDGCDEIAERDGKPIDVDTELGERLLEQPSNWKKADAKKAAADKEKPGESADAGAKSGD
jgi:hypothetical protein